MPFKPGYEGGPGRPTLPQDIKDARKMTKVELERVINKYLFMNYNEILNYTKNEFCVKQEIPAIEMLVARIIINAISKCDYFTLDSIMNRLIGRVKDEIRIEATMNYHSEIVAMIETMEYNSFLSNDKTIDASVRPNKQIESNEDNG